jgi:hypothetical protein
LDGTKAIIHMELLTVEQFNAIIANQAAEAIDRPDIDAMLATEEWTASDIV